MILLLQLFLAHILGDFFLQSSTWVKNKEAGKWASPYLYLHVLIHFVLILVITQSWANWKMAGIIAVMHLLTDGAKLMFQKEHTRRTWFLADQGMHLAVLVLVALAYEKTRLDISVLSDKRLLIPVGTFLLVLKPTSLLIKVLISRWAPASTINGADSLQNAGEWIGMLERLLVVIFLWSGRWEGVGFLLAAKSIFRFGDLREAKDKQLTEYVLIGTLLSFGIAIAVSVIALKLL